MSRGVAQWVCAAITLGVAQPSFAHHGTFVNYVWDEAFVAPAVVTEFRFTQPHPQIYLDVMDENGQVTNWACELGPNIPWLIREGWTRQRSVEALAPGTKLSVTITPAISGEPVGIVNTMQNEQGETLLVDFGVNRLKVVKVVDAPN